MRNYITYIHKLNTLNVELLVTKKLADVNILGNWLVCEKGVKNYTPSFITPSKAVKPSRGILISMI